MKRMLTLMLTLALALSLAACGDTTPEENTPTAPTVVLQDQLAQVPVTHYDWADDLPRMDGSTSTIPLEAGIRAALFGISQEEAELQVSHSTTYGSFYNLIDKKCDLIFSVPLSDKQIEQARERDMELEMTKIAAEGFVFVVNAQNPVDTLTQQQLKDIYSGKITNWSEVGGNDAPIIAYQRNETSGSQNFMHTFMGDTPLMEKLTDFVPSSMGMLMDAVAYYDNAENAIGYSVYAYAADMYGNGNEIKFIHVDGVEPTKATMAAGSYPLLSYNYAVYDKATPADSSLRKLVAWLDTDEGQRAVKAAGYIPLRDVGEVAETVVELYTAVGTGAEKPADYTPSLTWSRPIYGDSYGSTLVQTNSKTNEDLGIDGLANEELEREINTFFLETKEAFLETPGVTQVRLLDECINGYLAVIVSSHTEDYQAVDMYTRIYDLVAGKQIPYSDLFFKGESYVPAINTALSREFQKEDREQILKRGFAGLEAGHDAFSLTQVHYDSKSLYTAEPMSLTIPGLYTKSLLSVPRDLTGVFDDKVTLSWEKAEESAYVTNQHLVCGGWNGQLLDEGYYDSAVCEKINTRLRDIYQNEMSKDALADYYGDYLVSPEGCEMTLRILAGRWVQAAGGLFYPTAPNKELPWNYSAYYLFDLTTGEQVSYTALLKDGWEAAATWYQAGEELCLGDAMFYCDRDAQGVETVQKPGTDGWRFADLSVEENVVKVAFERAQPEFGCLWAEVPIEYLG